MSWVILIIILVVLLIVGRLLRPWLWEKAKTANKKGATTLITFIVVLCCTPFSQTIPYLATGWLKPRVAGIVLTVGLLLNLTLGSMLGSTLVEAMPVIKEKVPLKRCSLGESCLWLSTMPVPPMWIGAALSSGGTPLWVMLVTVWPRVLIMLFAFVICPKFVMFLWRGKRTKQQE